MPEARAADPYLALRLGAAPLRRRRRRDDDDDDDDAAEFDRARCALPGPVRLVVRLRVLPPEAHLGRPFFVRSAISSNRVAAGAEVEHRAGGVKRESIIGMCCAQSHSQNC